MFVIYEYAGCVLVAMIVAILVVMACAIFMVLKAGRGIMARKMHQLFHSASWLLGVRWAARLNEP